MVTVLCSSAYSSMDPKVGPHISARCASQTVRGTENVANGGLSRYSKVIPTPALVPPWYEPSKRSTNYCPSRTARGTQGTIIGICVRLRLWPDVLPSSPASNTVKMSFPREASSTPVSPNRKFRKNSFSGGTRCSSHTRVVAEHDIRECSKQGGSSAWHSGQTR